MQKLNNRPIGVFDSGLGGLTVVKELMKILPHEDIVYLGDTARVPYGPRGTATIRKFSIDNTKFLLTKKVKIVVIACNTSSAVAAGYIKNKFKKAPVFEVIEPASIDAVKKGERIGVIGTRGTVGSHAYPEKISKLRSGIKVFSVACPLFVPFIEEGEIESPALKIIAKRYLKELKEQNIDTLIMGCTHYPIIEDTIKKELGEKINLINPGKSVAREVAAYLEENKLLNVQKKNGSIVFYVTDLTPRFTKVAEMFLGGKIRGQLKKIELQSE